MPHQYWISTYPLDGAEESRVGGESIAFRFGVGTLSSITKGNCCGRRLLALHCGLLGPLPSLPSLRFGLEGWLTRHTLTQKLLPAALKLLQKFCELACFVPGRKRLFCSLL